MRRSFRRCKQKRCPRRSCLQYGGRQENMKKTIQIDGNEELVTLLAENMTQISVSDPDVFNVRTIPLLYLNCREKG